MVPEENRNIKLVVIKSLSFKRIRSVLTTKLETSNNYERYKIDTGIDGNLMPTDILKTCFLMLQISS